MWCGLFSYFKTTGYILTVFYWLFSPTALGKTYETTFCIVKTAMGLTGFMYQNAFIYKQCKLFIKDFISFQKMF